jgi:hypothetical protein
MGFKKSAVAAVAAVIRKARASQRMLAKGHHRIGYYLDGNFSRIRLHFESGASFSK